jgi:hypothetical protein
VLPFVLIAELSEWFALEADGPCCVLLYSRRIQIWWAGEAIAYEQVGLVSQ